MRRLDAHEDQAGAWDVLSAVSGALAFDIGANIGQAAKVLAQNFERVVSFEPCQESFDILQAACAPNVVPWLGAVSSQNGTVTLAETDQIETGQLTTGVELEWGPQRGERSVQAITLDAVIRQYGAPDFVKIDTEGHEVEVLKGWSDPLCPLIVEVHKAENEALVRELLPGYDLTKLTHGHWVEERIRLNHFWLHGSPA